MQSITRRESDHEGLLEESRDQNETTTPPLQQICDLGSQQRSSTKVIPVPIFYSYTRWLQSLDEIDNKEAAAMTEKYQRLWSKYKKQSARFRTLQQLLENAEGVQNKKRETDSIHQSNISSTETKLLNKHLAKNNQDVFATCDSKSNKEWASRDHVEVPIIRKERSRSSRNPRTQILRDSSKEDPCILVEEGISNGNPSSARSYGFLTESEDVARSEDSRFEHPRPTLLASKTGSVDSKWLRKESR